jgi:hypothetical protein
MLVVCRTHVKRKWASFIVATQNSCEDNICPLTNEMAKEERCGFDMAENEAVNQNQEKRVGKRPEKTPEPNRDI